MRNRHPLSAYQRDSRDFLPNKTSASAYWRGNVTLHRAWEHQHKLNGYAVLLG